MRTLIDVVCPGCGDVHADIWIRTEAPEFPWCIDCKRPTERHRRSAPAAHSDSYRGGLWIHHGLCNPDGSPRRYDSQSEIDREARRRGLRNIVDHQDGSKQTQRFV